MNKNLKLIIGVVIAVLAYLSARVYFIENHAMLIACIALLVTLWTNEALPLGVVSLLPMILFPAFGLLTTSEVADSYANPIIFLFLGGFMLAIATQQTGLHRVIAHKILQVFPATPRGIIFSMALTSALLSAFLSNTTTAVLLISIALFLTDDRALKVRLVLAVAYGASIGGIITPIGTPPNLILLGFFESQALAPIGFMQWIVMTLPLAMVMLLVIGFVLSYGVEASPIADLEQDTQLSKPQKQLALILLGMVLLLLVNSPVKPFYDGLGISEKGILLGFGLLMFMPFLGFLQWEDTKKIPYEIIFLFGAGFSIARAFLDTGFAGEIANLLTSFSHIETFYLVLLIAAFVTFSTEITSNTALVSMILPVIYALAVDTGLNHQLFLMVATICASYAFMLPIATPPNAIAMSSGVIRIKDMLSRGLLFNLVGVLMIALCAVFYWSGFFDSTLKPLP